jgi:hypothetical protein
MERQYETTLVRGRFRNRRFAGPGQHTRTDDALSHLLLRARGRGQIRLRLRLQAAECDGDLDLTIQNGVGGKINLSSMWWNDGKGKFKLHLIHKDDQDIGWFERRGRRCRW